MTTTHTPTPWIIGKDPAGCSTILHKIDGYEIASHVMAEDAKFIVSAVNAYEPMVSLLEKVARSACLKQEVNGKCICFSCESYRIIEDTTGGE